MNEAALENSDGLADTEIARLITLSNQASYSRSDIVPVREPSPFEPKSLVEIAMAAQKRRDEANARAAAEKVLSDQNATDQAVDEQAVMPEQSAVEATDDASAALSDEGTATSTPTDDAASMASSETESQSTLTADQAPDALADSATSAEGSAAQANTSSEEQTETEAGSANQPQPAPAAPATPDPAVLEAEYKRGQEAGLAEGQAKAAEQLEKVLQNFEQAVLALARPEAIDVSALSAEIASRIMALASDRAGQAITDMPEPFAKRVEDLITMVKSETASPTIYLNSEDLAGIKPLAQNRDKLKNCIFTVDDALARGDVRMTVGGVGLIDEISDRTNIVISDDTAKIADTDEISKLDKAAEVETQSDVLASDIAEPSSDDKADNKTVTKAGKSDIPADDKLTDQSDSLDASGKEETVAKTDKIEAEIEAEIEDKADNKSETLAASAENEVEAEAEDPVSNDADIASDDLSKSEDDKDGDDNQI